MKVEMSSVRTAVVSTVAATGVMFAAPAVTEAAFGDQTLRVGMSNSDVSTLQEKLKEKGHYTYTVDGVFGPLTRQAVMDYQRANNLQVDGIAGPQTFGALGTSSSSSSSSSSNSSSSSSGSSSQKSISSASAAQMNASQVLRPGSSGSAVEQLQINLGKIGFYKQSHTTGSYGNSTRDAVRDFQRARNLSVDGIAGPQTLGQLNREVNASSGSSSGSSSSGSSSTILRSGSSGEQVRNLQNRLKELNYFSGSVNGSYNSATQQAVRDFQRAAGIGVDGIAGPQTFGALDNASPRSSGSSSNTSSGSSSSGSSTSTATLRSGSTGEAVRSLQRTLTDLNYYSGPISSTFGPQTQQAVRDFQRAAGIGVDGVAGPQTFRALENASPRSSSGSSGGSNASSGSSSNTVLQHGARNDNVRELQDRLKAAGFFSGTSTGYFGDVTKRAVTQFQQRWGLTADGIVTTSTWNKLEEVSSIHQGNATPGSSGGGFNVTNLIADASALIGVPYRWGGTTTAGFDCSGFIQYVFKQNGKNLPRTAAQQHAAGSHVSSSNRRVGDIVFFETYTSGPSHNGIYIGNGQFIHAGSSTGVTIASLSSSYWSQRYLGTRRH
ncbi:C40 family peptidase [Alkalicoccus luteus]|uniref:C40 family peptidase n=1 Tax=Alkalicoccus luteus TaxID=1237094 RepID=UPI0040341E7C